MYRALNPPSINISNQPAKYNFEYRRTAKRKKDKNSNFINLRPSKVYLFNRYWVEALSAKVIVFSKDSTCWGSNFLLTKESPEKVK